MQAVVALLDETRLPDGRLEVRARLACGCEITKTVAADRVLVLGGERRVVGKLSCPSGHAVVRPGSAERGGESSGS